jgi:hypothetical protein
MEHLDHQVEEFMQKVKKMEQGEKLDLSSDEDLSIGIMNLISIEEHLFFTANKTGNDQYYELLNQIREMRKDLLKRIIKEYEGEVWCISKHLLASSMRLMEVGTKMLSKGDDKGAKDLFKKSYDLYSLFWGLNLKLVAVDDVKSTDKEEQEVTFTNDTPVQKTSSEKQSNSEVAGNASVFDKLGKLVQKAIDCCRE